MRSTYGNISVATSQERIVTTLPKHTDLLILATAVIAIIIGVVLYDKMEAREQVTLPASITGKSTLNSTDGTSDSGIAVAQANQVEDRPAWLLEDDPDPRSRNRVVPKPFQKGVVHLGPGASLGGRRPFPADNAWNQTIEHLPVDPMSEVLIAGIGRDKNVHPDFGAGFWEGAPTGIPYYVVSKDQPRVPIVYNMYGNESDPGPYPVPADAPIEGHPNEEGDRHVIIIDRDSWKLYELFRGFNIGEGQLWRAESGAIFDMNKHPDRPIGWTSADAAGLPIFPGLVRYDEVVEQQEIPHALRFTVNNTRRAFVPPATHWASRSHDPRFPPLGMRCRLKADFDISDYPPEAQVILRCLKKYGMILADNGSDWFISGAPDPRWNDEALRTLKEVKGHDFEVILMEGIVEDQ